MTNLYSNINNIISGLHILVFAPTIEHLKALLQQQPITQPYILITDAFSTAKLAQKHGLICHYLDSYLTPDECTENFKMAQQLAYTWHRSFSSQVFHRGVPFVQVAEEDMLFPFLGVLNSYRAFSRLLNEVDCKTVMLFEEMEIPTFCGGPEGVVHDLSNAVLAWLAIQKGISIQYLPAIQTQSIFANQALPPQCHRHSSYIPPRKLRDSYQQRWTKAKCKIMAFGMPSDFAQLGELPGRWGQEPDTCLIYVYDFPLYIEDQNILTMDFRSFLVWPFDLQDIDAQLDQSKQEFIMATSDLVKQHPCLFDNPFINFLFDAYFSSGMWHGHEFALKYYARIIEATHLMMEAFQPDLCLFGYDGIGPLHCRTGAIKAMGIPTITIAHGCMSDSQWAFTNLDTNSDVLCVPGEALRQRMIAHGRSKARVKAIGELSAGDRRDLGLGASPDQRLEVVKQTLQAIKEYIADRPMVLLLTGTPGCDIFQPCLDLGKHEQTWNRIVSLAKKRPDMAFVIKTHPRFDYHDFYQDICRDLDSNLYLVGGSHVGNPTYQYHVILSDLIPLCQVAVLVNLSHSSTISQVLSAQMPLICLRHAVINSKVLQDTPLDREGCRIVERLEDLEMAIDECLFDPVKRQSIIDSGQQLLKKEVDCTGDEAIQRLRDLIDELRQRNTLQVDPDTPPLALYIAMVASGFRHYLDTHEEGELREAMALLSKHLPEYQRPMIGTYLQRIQHLPTACI